MAFTYSVQDDLTAIGTAVSASFTQIQFFQDAVPSNLSSPDGLTPLTAKTAIALNYASNTLTLAAPISVLISATGTVASFRVYDANNTCTVQGSVGLTLVSDMVVDNVSLVAASSLVLNAFTLNLTVTP